MATCPTIFDALVIGAGPAGLSAGLALGRVLRTAAIFDTNVFRNVNANHMHTVPTWDHASPVTYRQQSITELRDKYAGTVQFTNTGVVSVQRQVDGSFSVVDQEGTTWTGKKIILATGVKDVLPSVRGYANAWGRTIFHCLFCHGFEERSAKKAGILILDKEILSTEVEIAVHFGHLAKQFAESLCVFLNGSTELVEDERIVKLKAQGFTIYQSPIEEIVQAEGKEPESVTVRLQDGHSVTLTFLIHRPRTVLADDFGKQLGVELTESGDIKTKPPFYETTVDGAFAAGDCAVPLKQVVWAAATGVSAGSGVNFQLLGQDMKKREAAITNGDSMASK